jgi:ubiquinone/menaquinone biosynthesis C-methylase UbiE
MLAGQLGARVCGIDASEPLVEIARQRYPAGDFQVGEQEDLPNSDEMFSVVTGFNPFQDAANPVRALREAKRVAQRGAPEVVVVLGNPDDCDAAEYVFALGRLLPPPPHARWGDDPVMAGALFFGGWNHSDIFSYTWF